MEPREGVQPVRRFDLDSLKSGLGQWMILAVVCAGFSLHPGFFHTFWTAEYLPNILQQAATNIILAVGLTFVILTGGIDLSVGSVLALSGVALGMSLRSGPPYFLAVAAGIPLAIGLAAWLSGRLQARGWSRERCWGSALTAACILSLGIGWILQRGLAGGARLEVALLVALGVGLAAGLLNGVMVAVGRVPAFVATLGMLTAARGLTVFATDGNSISGLPPRLGALGEGWPLVAIAGAVVVAATCFQTRTRAGRYLRAIGANEEAARLSGIPVRSFKVLAYALSGITAGIAAIVLTAKFQLADTGAGAGAELNAIAAVVIGGTSLNGGRGSVVGSLVGALTIAVLNSGLVLTGVKDTLQGVIIGGVIVAAVMLDRLRGSSRD